MLLGKFDEIFQNTVLQNNSRRQILICNFHRSYFSIEDCCLWIALMAAANHLVVTELVGYR